MNVIFARLSSTQFYFRSDIIATSISLGCFFFIDENGSLKRIGKDFFESDKNVTQGMSINTTNSYCPILVIQIKNFENNDVNQSFFDQAVKNTLMRDDPTQSAIFEFEYKAFEINSVLEKYKEFFYCWFV